MTKRERSRLLTLLAQLRDEMTLEEYTRETSGLVDAAQILIDYFEE